ncbi:acyl-CoA thioesterase/bile acid-CoA:amino acid N-acyltransferase family protein [Saccharothrix variisporea]|uniref:Acyl-CoA thioester hydrolase/bile acid acetyltransferase-like protein n=1 Tax=Saccharothrix variisporea TaxID=543527 RepID=A0A495XI10_9PSEU|nr:acyl-CoA thioesterase/bile acid-CoA:amino acid N-acyltransferase family protein [Saccharothrix variisporea]RKT72735.1 acyl-CoA thioester hydrolase/bile acid acetyltransferase-like protein [Saccharothrix variisporea]
MAEILVTPQSAPLDTTLEIKVVGLDPDAVTTVRATTGDRAAEAVFRADERGVVDLTRHAPVEGSYDGVDPMGLFWSMTWTGDEPGPTLVEVDGVGKVEVERLRVPQGLRRTEVTENGLVGVLYEPDDGDVHPGVIVLGGAEGGLHQNDPALDEDNAALLARYGFAALALAHFGADGLPDDLVDVPLEYFGTALTYLGDRRTGVVGAGRGGELALLVGATYPQVNAVVSVVGGGVVTQCVGPGTRLLEKLDFEAASWTYEGRPLPYLPYTVPDELRRRIVDGDPVPLALAYDLSDGIPEDTEIPVERINGGVLLLSSGRDHSRPSVALSAVAERRLAEHQHPFPYEHVVYPEAGHLIAGPPHRPTTDLLVPGPSVLFETGGTPGATAAARADAWHRTIEFLSDQLGT